MAQIVSFSASGSISCNKLKLNPTQNLIPNSSTCFNPFFGSVGSIQPVFNPFFSSRGPTRLNSTQKSGSTLGFNPKNGSGFQPLLQILVLSETHNMGYPVFFLGSETNSGQGKPLFDLHQNSKFSSELFDTMHGLLY